MTSQQQLYINGFNAGYTLAKHESGLLNKIMKGLHPVTDYLDGLFSGKEKYEQELTRQQIHFLRSLSKERGIDLEIS